MAEKIIKKKILDGERNLHIFHSGLAPDKLNMMGEIYENAVTICNNVLAKGLMFSSGAEMMAKNKNLMMFTKWNNFGKWTHKQSGQRRWEHACEFIWKEYSQNWRLDRRKETNEFFARVFGDKAKIVHEKLCQRSPFQKFDALGRNLGNEDMAEVAKTVKTSILSIIAGLNLKDIYVKLAYMTETHGGVTTTTLGSAATSHGSWRYTGHKMPLKRSEEHLYKWGPGTPINLHQSYLSLNIDDDYRDLYGRNYSMKDILTVTLIHEASHTLAASADYFYFEPKNKKLAADVSSAADATNACGIPDGNKIVNSPKTSCCAINADSLAWFMYFWGGGLNI